MSTDAQRRDEENGAAWRLHHFALDPFCRRLRLILGEYGVSCRLMDERPWLREEQLLALNPAGEVPVLITPEGVLAAGAYAATELLEETLGRGSASLLGTTLAQRAEVRRLMAFFDGHFFVQVSAPVLAEKGIKRLLPAHLGGGAPDTGVLRAALARLDEHLTLIDQLAETRGLLGGAELTLADLAAAAHLSVLEYLDALRFDGHEAAKLWYQRIKSRPSFRTLLKDRIAGLTPPPIYGALDF